MMASLSRMTHCSTKFLCYFGAIKFYINNGRDSLVGHCNHLQDDHCLLYPEISNKLVRFFYFLRVSFCGPLVVEQV